MDLVVSLFASVMKAIQCRAMQWMERACVFRDGLGMSVHCVRTI